MSLRASQTPTSTRGPATWAAHLVRAALADPAASNPALGVVSALIVFAAAVPFAGWAMPAVWLAVMLALALSEAVWPELGPRF